VADARAPHPFWTYSSEVLSFCLGAEAPEEAARPRLDSLRRQTLRAASRPQAGDVALLGLGSGELAAELAGLAGPDKRVVVAELDPAKARRLIARGKAPWFGPVGGAQLVADASALACGFLLRLAGSPGRALLILTNPELGEAEKKRYAPLRAFLAGHGRTAPDPGAEGRLRLSFAAIVHPGEPELAAFFSHASSLAGDMVLVWDGDGLPGAAAMPEIPGQAVQLARPLGADFAAQRNAMLAACPGEAVLSLDADERASPGLIAALPALTGFGGYAGVYLPRLTLAGGGERVLCGYGLWPDPQLRLYRKSPGASYVRPVHERIENLAGPSVIAPAATITHLSHVMKSASDWAEKLSRFDAASGGRVGHRLAGEYPSLPREFFDGLAARLDLATLWPVAAGAEREENREKNPF
jgi:hypothetical protein